jgi:hypothetical protein
MRRGKPSGTSTMVAFLRGLSTLGVTQVRDFSDPFAAQLLPAWPARVCHAPAHSSASTVPEMTLLLDALHPRPRASATPSGAARAPPSSVVTCPRSRRPGRGRRRGQDRERDGAAVRGLDHGRVPVRPSLEPPVSLRIEALGEIGRRDATSATSSTRAGPHSSACAPG